MTSERRVQTPSIASSYKTPGTVRVRQHFNYKPLPDPDDASINDDDDDDKSGDPLEALLKQSWNVWGVSPLFQFNYQSERHLKLYGKRLREELASLLPKENVKYEVKLEIDKNIDPRPSTTDPPAIKIEVLTEDIEKEVQKCIYTGILLSWGSSIVGLEDITAVKLPLLLCRGNKTAIRAVNTTLKNMFDCTIVSLSASEEDLRWLAPIMLNLDNEEEEKGHMGFEYILPGRTSSDNVIYFSWEISVLIKLWTIICESDSSNNFNENNFILKNIEKFYQLLQKQILQDSGLQIGFSKLCKISLPYIAISDNRIKASTSQAMNKALLFFNEKAIETLHFLNFDASSQSHTFST